jgi:heptosyltransferase-2
MAVYTTDSDEAAVERLWQCWALEEGSSVVALNPGAAFGSAKHWPTDSFAQLAQRLARELGAKVVVLCGPAERNMARQIVQQSRHPGIHSLAAEPLSLGLLKAFIRRADLLITTDSGPRHFAAALDRPVITLFGPTHIAWTETYHPKAIHLQQAVACGPCQRRVCPLDHRCMRELSPEQVYQTALTLLARYPGRKCEKETSAHFYSAKRAS